jgi:ABC-type proline/glycine betaine transport system permease subunit
VPIGIAAAHRPWLEAALRPLLDLMQTIPTFVYLIPTLILFGLGVVPGLISTVIFALPAPIRLTTLGVASVPRPLIEAGQAFGASRWQLLWKVEIPSALPSIMAGVTQCIMLSLSMVVIAALVGADGLGKPVVRALNSVNIADGFEAGLAIVIVAILGPGLINAMLAVAVVVQMKLVSEVTEVLAEVEAVTEAVQVPAQQVKEIQDHPVIPLEEVEVVEVAAQGQVIRPVAQAQ